jgi:uncharacterized membrane protein
MVVLAVGLFVTMGDVPMAWIVWPVGYGVVLPLAIGYAKRRDERMSDTRADDEETEALARAKQRYVDGDIDEAEFEAAVEATLDEEDR